MIGTNTFTPTIEKDKVPGSQKPGAWGFFSEDESALSLTELRKLPEHVLGEITDFNKVVDAGKDIIDAGKGIMKVFALEGEYIITNKNHAPQAQPEAKGPESAEPRKLTEPEIHAWFARINTEETNIEYQNKMKDVFRITEGQPPTDIEAREMGYQRRDSIATAMGVARKRIEVQVIAEDRQDAAETAFVKPAGVPGQNDLINNEGGSKYTGVSSSIG